jgi:hypothetical protein
MMWRAATEREWVLAFSHPLLTTAALIAVPAVGAVGAVVLCLSILNGVTVQLPHPETIPA